MRTRRLEGERRLDWGAGGGFSPADLSGHVETWIGATLPESAAAATWPGLTGTHTLSQATGGFCPLIATDAGKRYALFDGTDDFMIKDPYTQGSAAGHSAFVAMRLGGNGNFPMVFTTANSVRELRFNGTNRFLEWEDAGPGGATVDDVAVPTGEDHVVGVTAASGGGVTLWLDGVAVATGTESGDYSATPSTALSLGNRVGGALYLPAGSRVYAATFCEASLSAAEVALLNDYLKSHTVNAP